MASLVVITVSLAAFSGVWAVTSRPMPHMSNLRRRIWMKANTIGGKRVGRHKNAHFNDAAIPM